MTRILYNKYLLQPPIMSAQTEASEKAIVLKA